MTPAACRIVDAAREFLEDLSGLGSPTPDELFDFWENYYRSAFPELYAKQIEDYASLGQDWRHIALSKVFPRLPDRLPHMKAARERLLSLWGEVVAKAQTAVGFRAHVVAVVHVGIGCGAGWVTTYEGKPACLFGLENIAELGWHKEEKLQGLIAHELGHVAHSVWRGEPLEPIEEDSIGLLYTEGFAQRMEGKILGQESWHHAPDDGWLPWCRANLQDIARAYLECVEHGGEAFPFFGSWYSYRGIPFTGYFLGHALVRHMEETHSLQEIARMPLGELKPYLLELLRRLATGRAP